MFKAVSAFSGFSAPNLKQVAAFYSDVLGLDVATDAMGLSVHLPSGARVFVYEKADHQPAVYTVLNLVVTDIDDAVDQLTQSGVQFERYENMPAPQDEKGILRGLSAGMGPDIAWFKDPAGNVFAILQDEEVE